MKKRLLIFCVVAGIVMVSGCTDRTLNVKTSDTVISYSKEDMKLGYDGQAFFSNYNREFAETEEGYYYFDYSNMYAEEESMEMLGYLMFFDKESEISVPVCNLVECMHEKGQSECNAQFRGSFNGAENLSLPYFLWYYDGNLYTIMVSVSDNNYEYDLYQISLDGSKRTKYAELYALYEEKGVSTPEAFYHRGYVYYTITERDGIECLFRVKVEKDAKPEQIVKLDNVNSFISEFQIYNTGITYAEKVIMDGKLISSVKYFDENSGKLETILNDTVFTMYTVVSDIIYYTSDTEIYAYDIENKDTNKIYSMNNGGYISYDGVYLYAEVPPVSLEDYSEHYIYVLDLEGNLIDTIQAPSSQNCYFGDSDYLFQMFDLNENLTGRSDMPMIKAFDKSQIGTGSHEWIELPIAK